MWDAGHCPAPTTNPRYPIEIADLAVSARSHGPMARVAHEFHGRRMANREPHPGEVRPNLMPGCIFIGVESHSVALFGRKLTESI